MVFPRRRAGGIRRPGTLLLLTFLIFVSTFGAIAVSPIHVARAAEATAATDLTLRAGAGGDFEALTVIPAGAVISVDGDPVNGYYPVSYTGIAGWAAAEFVVFGGAAAPVEASGGELTKDAAAEIAATGSATTVDSVNLRAGPSTEDAVLAELPAGTIVSLTGQQTNGFLEVVANGATGWVSADFLGTGGAAAPAPAEVAPPAPVEAAPAADVPAETAPAPSAAPASYSERQIIQIIHEAADRYNQPRDDMLRVARCESNLDPRAINGPGNTHGLFQFLPGTFATTPFAEYDIYDPWANANAAGWMWSEGRRNEWVCQ